MVRDLCGVLFDVTSKMFLRPPLSNRTYCWWFGLWLFEMRSALGRFGWLILAKILWYLLSGVPGYTSNQTVALFAFDSHTYWLSDFEKRRATAHGTTGQRDNGTTGQRDNGTTGQRDNGTTGHRANGTTGQRDTGPTGQRDNGTTGHRANGTPGQRDTGPTGHRANGTTGQRDAGKRPSQPGEPTWKWPRAGKTPRETRMGSTSAPAKQQN